MNGIQKLVLKSNLR